MILGIYSVMVVKVFEYNPLMGSVSAALEGVGCRVVECQGLSGVSLRVYSGVHGGSFRVGRPGFCSVEATRGSGFGVAVLRPRLQGGRGFVLDDLYACLEWVGVFRPGTVFLMVEPRFVRLFDVGLGYSVDGFGWPVRDLVVEAGVRLGYRVFPWFFDGVNYGLGVRGVCGCYVLTRDEGFCVPEPLFSGRSGFRSVSECIWDLRSVDEAGVVADHNPLWGGDVPVYEYDRVSWDGPGRRLPGRFAFRGGRDSMRHPLLDRPLTVREGLRLRGFPDVFVVGGGVRLTPACGLVVGEFPFVVAECLVGQLSL